MKIKVVLHSKILCWDQPLTVALAQTHMNYLDIFLTTTNTASTMQLTEQLVTICEIWIQHHVFNLKWNQVFLCKSTSPTSQCKIMIPSKHTVRQHKVVSVITCRMLWGSLFTFKKHCSIVCGSFELPHKTQPVSKMNGKTRTVQPCLLFL